MKGNIKYNTLEEINRCLPPQSMLEAIEILPDGVTSKGRRDRMVLCLCRCGKRKPKRLFKIFKYDMSCGCLGGEITRKRQQKYFPHIKSLYNTYTGMMHRCYNERDKRYKDYGGRGVSVCDEWKKNYQNFLDWSLANGWHKGLQLDKDIKGNGLIYSPESCCWITGAENNRARKDFKKYMFDGSLMTIRQISIKEGVTYSCLYWRVGVKKLSIEESLKKIKNGEISKRRNDKDRLIGNNYPSVRGRTKSKL